MRISAQPPPWLAAGLLLVCAGVLVRLFWLGATAGDPSVLAAADGVGLGLGDDVVGAGVTGTALVGAGAGTDEICELCETCEICPGPPDTCDWWLTCEMTPAGP